MGGSTVVEIGRVNNLQVVREADFGYYLDAETGNTSDDILLPIKSALGKEISIGDRIDAFIYRDSKDRPIATLKNPIAQVGELAYLEVVSVTKIGSFVNFGLEKDILVPFKEENYRLEVGSSYLFYIYLDKTGRIAASTRIDSHLEITNKYKENDEITGTVYGFQTNGSVMVAVDNLYKAVILTKEYFTRIKPGEVLNLRVRKYFEDGRLEVTPRKDKLTEKEALEEKILDYLKKHKGQMSYNDKSSSEDIKKVFGSSKNYFKNALGGLMKRNLITQDEEGTKLL